MDLRVEVARLERLVHPRQNGRQLRRRGAEDDRDDVPAVRRLLLQQPSGFGDVDPDAVRGHAELEVAGGAGAVVASPAGRRNEEHVRFVLEQNLPQDRRPQLRVVLGERGVVRRVDHLGAVRRGLASGALEPLADEQGDGSSAELSREGSATGDQLQ